MYDQFAAAYAADNETNAYNALYEGPAMLALLGDLRGKRVLDAEPAQRQQRADTAARERRHQPQRVPEPGAGECASSDGASPRYVSPAVLVRMTTDAS
jgi:hypothetical protein